MFQREKREKLRKIANSKGFLDLHDLHACEVAGEELETFLEMHFLEKVSDDKYAYVGPKEGKIIEQDFTKLDKELYKLALEKRYGDLVRLLSTKNKYSSTQNAIVLLLGVLKSLPEDKKIPIVKHKQSSSFIQAIFKYDFYQAMALLREKERTIELSYSEKTILILLDEVLRMITQISISLPKNVESSLSDDSQCFVHSSVLISILNKVMIEQIPLKEVYDMYQLTCEQAALVHLVFAKELMRNGRFGIAESLIQEVRSQNFDSSVIQILLMDVEANMKNMRANPRKNSTSLDLSMKRVRRSCFLKENEES